ncbi:small integral membrane protein 14 [Planococcus citri]|uniref:small integral membrane protein 14 n=1 Tax=Planococcus citri TaxID=170843 RepID=UPI0031F73CA9
MNPCECIFNQEMAMRRLLSLLRQTQSECTDSECLDLTNLNLGDASSVDNSVMMYSMLWIAIGFLLYFFRPPSLRNTKNIFRRSNDDNDNSPGPSQMAPGAQ